MIILEDPIDIVREVFKSKNMEHIHFPFNETVSNGYLVIRGKLS